MAFFDFIKSGVDFLTGKSVLSQLTRTVLLGFAVNKLSKSTQKTNPTAEERPPEPDPGVKLQFEPSTTNRIPVVYGRAHVAGAITDVHMTADQKTMYFVLTLSEITGTLLSTGAATEYLFREAYADDRRIVFKGDGTVVDYTVDREGTVDDSLQDLMEIHFYQAGTQLPPDDFFANPAWVPANQRMPNWTSNHTMDELLFAVVKITYNKERGVTRLPTMTFDVQSTMRSAGDVLYDYMTNTRYGAGIDPEEIYSA